MPHRLLIVEHQPLPPEASLDRQFPIEAGIDCAHLRWDSALPERLGALNAELIVALAVPEPAPAISFFQWLRDHPLSTPTLAVLPEDSEGELLRAASETVDDFVFWPFRKGELHQRVLRMLGTRGDDLESVHDRIAREMGLAQLVGKDPAFVRAIEKIPLFAASDAPVLLQGETGTGKELCARAIHHLSPRANFPFIPVECGAIPEHLAENELFGHMRGAYTDAHADQKGLVGLAAGGTLFLDEIDALSPGAQAKLLRFLEGGTYRALGAERITRVDVRVIAAANCDLELAIREKQFRSDLYFRLNVLGLRLPSLRERRGDIRGLAQHFLEARCAATGQELKTFSPAALRRLELCDWPGNVRELLNVVRQAAVLCTGPQILSSHISFPSFSGSFPAAPTNFRQARLQAIASFERLYVEEMLRKHGGNITRAALEVGKDRRAFGRLVKKYGISPQALK